MSREEDSENVKGMDASQTQSVLVFRPYPLKTGDRIYIEHGPRRGDWEVIGVSDRKVMLRCPVTHREVEWNRFCYFMEEQVGAEWPHKH